MKGLVVSVLMLVCTIAWTEGKKSSKSLGLKMIDSPLDLMNWHLAGNPDIECTYTIPASDLSARDGTPAQYAHTLNTTEHIKSLAANIIKLVRGTFPKVAAHRCANLNYIRHSLSRHKFEKKRLISILFAILIGGIDKETNYRLKQFNFVERSINDLKARGIINEVDSVSGVTSRSTAYAYADELESEAATNSSSKRYKRAASASDLEVPLDYGFFEMIDPEDLESTMVHQARMKLLEDNISANTSRQTYSQRTKRSLNEMEEFHTNSHAKFASSKCDDSSTSKGSNQVKTLKYEEPGRGKKRTKRHFSDSEETEYKPLKRVRRIPGDFNEYVKTNRPHIRDYYRFSGSPTSSEYELGLFPVNHRRGYDARVNRIVVDESDKSYS